MKIFVTGSCGFIGGHLCEKLLINKDNTIIGIDNLNSVIYDNNEKKKTLLLLSNNTNYIHIDDSIENDNYILKHNPDIVIHLAAYANVQKSRTNPVSYVSNNIGNTCKLLDEIAKLADPQKPLFIYASSSSIYGTNTKVPFSESDPIDNIISPYALTKKMCEDFVNLYCKIGNIKAIGLRFFTVYGPRGRPDMVPFIFLKKIMNGEEITMYGDGTMERDFTYIDDIVNGIINCFSLDIKYGTHKIFNLGNNKPIPLIQFIKECEIVVGKKACICIKPVLPGDVPITCADITNATRELFYNPEVDLHTGLDLTYKWLNSI
jgi:UDP-glucuronate 4-epimerase